MRWLALACALGLLQRTQSYAPRGTVCSEGFFEPLPPGSQSPPEEWKTDFEGSGYTQWKTKSRRTPTWYTGPNSAFEQSYYYYVETNPWRLGYSYSTRPASWYRLPDDEATLESPMVLGATYVSFYYHMYGYGIGSLEVRRGLSPPSLRPRTGHWATGPRHTQCAAKGPHPMVTRARSMRWTKDCISLAPGSGERQANSRGERTRVISRRRPPPLPPLC